MISLIGDVNPIDILNASHHHPLVGVVPGFTSADEYAKCKTNDAKIEEDD